MKRIKRLHLPHLRLVLALVIDVLIVWQRLANASGWLRPWLLPGRRKLDVSWYHSVGERRQSTPNYFGMALWAVAIYVFALLTWSSDPRPALLLAAEYGLLAAVYIFVRLASLVKRRMA